MDVFLEAPTNPNKLDTEEKRKFEFFYLSGGVAALTTDGVSYPGGSKSGVVARRERRGGREASRTGLRLLGERKSIVARKEAG